MPQIYDCPRCGGEIRYRVNLWTPWRTNPEFRCPHCASMLKRVHTVTAALTKFVVCLAFLGTEFGFLVWNRQMLFSGDPSALQRLVAHLLIILAVYLLIMRFVTKYRLVVRREVSLPESDTD